MKLKKGVIRYIGLSNETPWGHVKFLHLAEKFGLEKLSAYKIPIVC